MTVKRMKENHVYLVLRNKNAIYIAKDAQSVRNYRSIQPDSRSYKNFQSSLADISGYSLSRPPSYDQLSRRSLVEGPNGQGITSNIEGVLWSDEEETEYFYHENIGEWHI